jgi:hypothetical protein
VREREPAYSPHVTPVAFRPAGGSSAWPGQGLGSPVPAPNHHQAAVGRLLDTRHRNLVESQHPREAPRPRFSITRSSCALPGSLVLVWALGGHGLGFGQFKGFGRLLTFTVDVRRKPNSSSSCLAAPRGDVQATAGLRESTGEHGRLTACFGARTGARHSSQAPLESTR